MSTATGGKRLFLRSFNNEFLVNSTHVSRCPSDIGGWAIRIPFSTIWTYGHNSIIGCLQGQYSGSFDAKSSNIQYAPGGASKG
jgi:hypothetical protein